jgi:hypothetical protein
MSTFTTITNNYFYEILKVDSRAGETDWSINKNAKVGDCVLLYVCAPVSAIVATAVISDDVYLDEDINSTWFGTWFAQMSELKMLDIKVTRHQLRQAFHDWKYWMQPRNSVLVKPEYLPQLEELLFYR